MRELIQSFHLEFIKKTAV